MKRDAVHDRPGRPGDFHTNKGRDECPRCGAELGPDWRANGACKTCTLELWRREMSDRTDLQNIEDVGDRRTVIGAWFTADGQGPTVCELGVEPIDDVVGLRVMGSGGPLLEPNDARALAAELFVVADHVDPRRPDHEMTVQDFQEQGFLLELNRRFLHPLGVALAIVKYADTPWHRCHILDHRDDPEGIRFAELDERDQRLSDQVATLERNRAPERRRRLGYWVQPIPRSGDTLAFTGPADDEAMLAAIRSALKDQAADAFGEAEIDGWKLDGEADWWTLVRFLVERYDDAVAAAERIRTPPPRERELVGDDLAHLAELQELLAEWREVPEHARTLSQQAALDLASHRDAVVEAAKALDDRRAELEAALELQDDVIHKATSRNRQLVTHLRAHGIDPPPANREDRSGARPLGRFDGFSDGELRVLNRALGTIVDLLDEPDPTFHSRWTDGRDAPEALWAATQKELERRGE